jgi:hypothetical protein
MTKPKDKIHPIEIRDEFINEDFVFENPVFSPNDRNMISLAVLWTHQPDAWAAIKEAETRLAELDLLRDEKSRIISAANCEMFSADWYLHKIYIEYESLMKKIILKQHSPESSELCLYDIFYDSMTLGSLCREFQLSVNHRPLVIAKLAERQNARQNSEKGVKKVREQAQQRQSLWFAHLDHCMKSRRWLLMSDPRKLREAVRSFEASHKDEPHFGELFGRITLRWYEAHYEEWRLQRLDILEDFEN